MSIPLLPSFRRQQLVLDFSSLKDYCPEGLYLSLTPGDPSLWAAVLFIRKGPYEGAVLRFQLLFPDKYPDIPPLVTFSSDVFHPLVVPLITYTFSANALGSSTTVSATHENRLPSGAFSLRYGFPKWFLAPLSDDKDEVLDTTTAPDAARPSTPSNSTLNSGHTDDNDQPHHDTPGRRALILNVLLHIQDSFENEVFLDSIPLDAVGDPSAWHAWRAYRGITKGENQSRSSQNATPSSPRNPGEWKWDGVWESRVRNGIDGSISEAALFGNTSSGARPGPIAMESTTTDPRRGLLAVADRQIRFSKLSGERYEELKGGLADPGSTVPA